MFVQVSDLNAIFPASLDANVKFNLQHLFSTPHILSHGGPRATLRESYLLPLLLSYALTLLRSYLSLSYSLTISYFYSDVYFNLAQTLSPLPDSPMHQQLHL